MRKYCIYLNMSTFFYFIDYILYLSNCVLITIFFFKEGGVHGDGYNGKESPHTEFEMFEGLTVARAAIVCIIK